MGIGWREVSAVRWNSNVRRPQQPKNKNIIDSSLNEIKTNNFLYII